MIINNDKWDRNAFTHFFFQEKNFKGTFPLASSRNLKPISFNIIVIYKTYRKLYML